MTTKDPVTGTRPLGRFKVSQHFIRRAGTLLAETVFKGMVVVRAEADYASDSIEYVGLHPAFEDVLVGVEVPEYVCEATQHPDGTFTVAWRKAESGPRWTPDHLDELIAAALADLQAKREAEKGTP